MNKASENTIQKVKLDKDKEKQIALDRQQRQFKVLQSQNDGVLSPVKSHAVVSSSRTVDSSLASLQWKTFLETINKSQQLNGIDDYTVTNNMISITFISQGKMKILKSLLR